MATFIYVTQRAQNKPTILNLDKVWHIEPSLRDNVDSDARIYFNDNSYIDLVQSFDTLSIHLNMPAQPIV